MKRILAIGLAMAGLVSATWVYANHPGKDGKNWEKRIEHMKAELSLTADQEAKIRDVFAKQREKIQAVREETRKTVSSILTPEQRQKFEQMKEKRKEHKSQESKD